MNVNLGTQWEEYIDTCVHTGRYLSASEVVREALRLLQEREQLRQLQLDQLRREIDRGVQQLERGEYLELDEGGLRDHIEKVKHQSKRKTSRSRAGAAR